MIEISELKKALAKDSKRLIEFLEAAGFWNIKEHDSSIRFGRDENSNPNSIILYMDDNLSVTDFARNIHSDIFGYVMKVRNMTFPQSLNLAMEAFGNEAMFSAPTARTAFGGWFSNLSRFRKQEEPVIYPDSILDKYEKIPNTRFLNDHISLEAQKTFGLRYDFFENGIVIPYRSPDGKLIGIKCRVNEDNPTGAKYFSLVETAVGQTLYGFCENYSELVSSDTIYVFEAEKSVMQAYTFGAKNCVSIGGNSLSKTQVKLLLQLNPKKIVLALDKTLNHEVIERNAKALKAMGKYRETEIGYLNMENDPFVGEKESPTDNGEEEFNRIKMEDYERLF